MVEIVTYYSENASHAEKWLAFVVLPTGEQWLVRFSGESEEAVKAKAASFWEKELEKRRKQSMVEDEDEWTSRPVGRGAHFIGTTWVLHKMTREKKRLPVAEAKALLNSGEWERGGPRSK